MTERLGDYELLDKLGVGGMGTVWRARDRRDGSIVAVKVLYPHLAADDEYVRRFQREVRIAQGIDSAHVVKVLDSGSESDSYFLVMEYVAGETLAQLVQKRGRLPIDEAVVIARDVARGLAAAHARGVVHRDVSPQNVIITSGGAVKLTDFGVARDLAATAMTATSMLLGKPEYIAPEVVTGRVKPDIRADIYALGVVLYQMLAGSVPFHSETPYAVLMQQINDAPPDIATVRKDAPPWLASVIARCLAKDPENRFETPGALVQALEARRAVPIAQTSTAPLLTPVAGPQAASHRRGVFRLALVASVTALGTAVAMVAFVISQAGTGDRNDLSLVVAESTTSPPSTQALVEPTPSSAAVRGPVPTPVAPLRVCPTAPPATDAEAFKGCLIYEANLDGTGSSFLLPRHFARCGQGVMPNVDEDATSITFRPGAADFRVLRQWGLTNVGLNLLPRATYVAEYDLQFTPGSENELLFRVRTSSAFHLLLYLEPRASAVYVRKHNTATNRGEDVTNRSPVTGLKTGRRLTLAVAADLSRYVVLIDGKTVHDFQDATVGSAPQRPIIQTQSCAGYAGLGTVQVLGARVYELAGSQ